MNYVLIANVTIAGQPDGASGMTVPSMQSLLVAPANIQVANSGSTGAPSAATIATAVSSLGTLLNSQLGTLNLATIQAWSTGNP
jgi:hypothetical protein